MLMKNLIKISQLFIILIFISSCKPLIKEETLLKDKEDKQMKNVNIEKNKLEIRFSCGEDGISEFLKDGWIIVEEYSEEKICTWKSFPANKNCNMEKDKGCKITKPDKIGEEKVYILER